MKNLSIIALIVALAACGRSGGDSHASSSDTISDIQHMMIRNRLLEDTQHYNIILVGDVAFATDQIPLCPDAAAVQRLVEWTGQGTRPCSNSASGLAGTPVRIDYVGGQHRYDAVCGTFPDGRHICTEHWTLWCRDCKAWSEEEMLRREEESGCKRLWSGQACDQK